MNKYLYTSQTISAWDQLITLIPLIISILILIILVYYVAKLYKALMKYLKSNSKN